MAWNRWYGIKSYIGSSLWVIPFVALVLEQIVLRTVLALSGQLDWTPLWPLTEAATSSALQTIITLSLSFLVFTFGSILVAIQVASGQLTPRIIATALLRDNVIRLTAGLFVFTLLFAIGAVARPNLSGPRLILWLAGFLGLASIAAFLYLIDYAARLLRPGSILWRIAEDGLAVIEDIYPRSVEESDHGLIAPAFGTPAQTIPHRGSPAVVIAINIPALVAEARRSDGLIELVPRVGNFVDVGEPLFKLHGGRGAMDQHRLRSLVAFASERTIEQDATFAIRVIVDVASKALSPAINDPTTGVLALDQLHRLLRKIGLRHLHDEIVTDSDGTGRLVLRTPNWDDFVQLSFCEIRLYGAGNFQIARRLRAMIEDLIANLPERRRPPLRRELELLDQSIERLYNSPEDRALARTPDMQGLGGAMSVKST
ncbi:DUF2254 domain-containing protein [Rhodoblastus sp. 17X3]|uniref:DUF2254 domain-containing protein n=1 Tax=Rhodoblastus sp. 17X3 TaxID=3047026 RepID=UPI0024B8244D|nr:DUF2254 domain-containing protein [Rhodoblastus sp. 17X3]MDI9847540.1 DUF2254 domain-containing protein [Rhodoblastus sp. 17X3]